MSTALPLALMLVSAPIGALDAMYFHMLKFRLYEAPTALRETLLHLMRGLGFSCAAFVLANCHVTGLAFWLLGVVFVSDVLINVFDVLLEPASRAPLGGIPPLEYLLHIIGSMFAGGVLVSYFVAGPASTALPLPRWLIWQGNLAAIGAAMLTLLELGLLLRSRSARRTSVAA